MVTKFKDLPSIIKMQNKYSVVRFYPFKYINNQKEVHDDVRQLSHINSVFEELYVKLPKENDSCF